MNINWKRLSIAAFVILQVLIASTSQAQQGVTNNEITAAWRKGDVTAVSKLCGGVNWLVQPYIPTDLVMYCAKDVGDPFTMGMLAMLYLDRQQQHGFPLDPKQAMYWATESANRGHFAGMGVLAQMYYLGIGVNKDLAKANQWCDAVAKTGFKANHCEKIQSDAAAQGITSKRISTPIGSGPPAVANNVTSAQAIPDTRSTGPAQGQITSSSVQSGDAAAAIVRTMKPEESAKFQETLLRATGGDAEAQFLVGVAANKANDKAEAQRWWLMAGNQGSLKAAASLCWYYDLSKQPEMIKWCQIGASRDGAYMEQGQMYFFSREGIFVPKNEAEANRWLQMMEQSIASFKSSGKPAYIGKTMITDESVSNFLRKQMYESIAGLYEKKAYGGFGQHYVSDNDLQETLRWYRLAGYTDGSSGIREVLAKSEAMAINKAENAYRKDIEKGATAAADRLPDRVKDALRYLKERSSKSSVRLADNYLVFEEITRRAGDNVLMGKGTAIALNATDPIGWQYDKSAPSAQIIGRTVFMNDSQTYKVFRVECTKGVPCITERYEDATTKTRANDEYLPFNADDGIINAMNHVREYVVKTYGSWKPKVATDAWGGQKRTENGNLEFGGFLLPPAPPRFVPRCKRENNC